MTRHLPLLVLLVSSGCGVTFGADAVEHVRDIKADPNGVTDVRAEEIGVLDEVKVCGGAPELKAKMTAVEWVEAGADPQVAPIDFAFSRRGAVVDLNIGGSDESVTLERVELYAPSSVAPEIGVSDGELIVCDFDAPVTVSEGHTVTLRDLRGPADVDADSVTLEDTGTVDLATSGEVRGEIASGGYVSAAGADLTLTGPAIEDLEVEATDSEGSGITLYLPPGAGVNLRVQTGGTAKVLVGDIDYYAGQGGASPPEDGITFAVNGGGPLVDLVTSSGKILVLESP